MNEKHAIQVSQEKETFARLMKSYVDDSVMLTDHEKEAFDMLTQADELIKDFNFSSTESRAKELAKRCGISLRHARNMLMKAKDFFNEVDYLDQATASRVLIHQCDKFLALCEGINDFKQAASFLKIKAQITADLIANKPIDPKVLQQNNYRFVIGGTMKELGSTVTRQQLLDELAEWGIEKAEVNRIMKEVSFDDVTPITDGEPLP